MRRLVILFAVLVLWSIPASAQLGFYLGAGGTSTIMKSGGGVARNAASVGLVTSGELDDAAFGGQIFAGLMFTPTLGVEVKYSDSGDATTAVALFDPAAPGAGQLVDIEASIDGYTIYGVGSFPFVGSDVAEFSIKAGYTIQDGKVTASGFDLGGAVPDDDKGFAISTGLRFRIGDHFAISAEMEYFNIDFNNNLDEPIRFGLNAEFHL